MDRESEPPRAIVTRGEYSGGQNRRLGDDLTNHDASMHDDARRHALYAGDLFVDSPTPQTTSFCEFTRELIVEAFGGRDPETAQYHHLHSSLPNATGRTRFSIDFRVVDVEDIERGIGAPNIDAHCTGSSIRDFMRASDFAPMPDAIVRRFEDGTESTGELLYADNVADRASAGD